jgi:hypothetical protein
LREIALEIIVGDLKHCCIVELAVMPFQLLVWHIIVQLCQYKKSMNMVNAKNFEIMRD